MRMLAVFGIVLSSSALAQDAAPASSALPLAPTAEEIKKVTDYFLRGAPVGPVLIDFIPCAKTGKSAEGKLQCEERLGAKVKKGDPIIAFVKFFVPKGAKYEDLKVRFLLNGEVRSTSDFTLTESWTGYSNYKQTTASKAGTWEMQVLRGETILSKASVTAE